MWTLLEKVEGQKLLTKRRKIMREEEEEEEEEEDGGGGGEVAGVFRLPLFFIV